jgi:DNA-binding CsgD family transcriptional regulator
MKRPLPSAGAAFVGYEPEMGALHAMFAAAVSGRGGLALLAGEPGIGKTRIARELAERARRQGAAVLWGRCYEGEGPPPYAPWVEALGSYTRGVTGECLRAELGSGAPPLARLVPEVREALPEVPAAAPLSPDEELVRLYDAVAQFLLRAAAARPLVLVLDDLHWADRDSLGLLRHAARHVCPAGTPRDIAPVGTAADRSAVLIIGTYRDVELDPQHPLTEVLAILRHETDYERIALRGLGEHDVGRYLAQTVAQDPPPALVRALHAETGGNPFYVREIVRHLAEEGRLVRRAGGWDLIDGGDLGVPEGVRQVVSRRLLRLSGDAMTTLYAAAAFTGGFEFRLLQALTDLPEAGLLDCIDQALAAGLIRAMAGTGERYDFAHAIVRHTLYDELSPSRRARLHRRVAEALARIHAGRGPQHAAEIAAQYHASAALPDADHGIPYAIAAAEQATAAYAHEQAVAFLRMARDLAAEGPAAVRADILFRLGVAEAEALLLEDARRSVEEALAAAGEAGWADADLAPFLAMVARVLKDGGAPSDAWEPLVERGLALASVSGRRDLTWARLTLLRDRVETIADGPISAGRWTGHDPEAVAIAREQGDEDDYARTLEPFEYRTRAQTDAVLDLARRWRRPTAVIRALEVVARDLLHRHGDFREAVAWLQELMETGARYGSIPAQVEALVQLAGARLTLGEPAPARAAIERARDLVGRLGDTHRLHLVVDAMALILSCHVDRTPTDYLEELDRVTAGAAMGRSAIALNLLAGRALAHSLCGHDGEVHRLLAGLTPVLECVEPTVYMYGMAVTNSAAAAWELNAPEFAGNLHQILVDLIAAGARDPMCGSLALSAARMAALLGDVAQAEAHFARARADLDASGGQLMRSMTDYDEARALIRAGTRDRARIAALLDSAVTAFRSLGMQGWAERAARDLDLMQTMSGSRAAAGRPYPDGLTARQAEVLCLIASGHGNREIADALVLTLNTVERHITNIYAKIGAHNRADATAYALRHGLITDGDT